jgi:hypothetical protein
VTCDEGENLLRDRFDWRPAAVNVLATKYPSFRFRPLKDELIGKRLRPLVLDCGNSFPVLVVWRASFTARVRSLRANPPRATKSLARESKAGHVGTSTSPA